MKSLNNDFYDSLSKAKAKAEIDTLNIRSTNTDHCLETIKNAYLFKIKTITISNISEFSVFLTIFKLSNNPDNTVKRIIINKSEKNLNEIISEIKSLNLKDYNIKKLPRIYIQGYQELMLDEINNEHSFLNSEYKYTVSFFLILKSNSIEVKNLTELLYMLFNSTNYLKKLTVEYEEINIKLKNTNPQYLIENKNTIILGMMEIYDKFKVDKIQFKRNENSWFEFKFNKNSPELNFIYFTVLEIMVLMKIEIKNFILEGCPISEFVEFLEKHKSLDSLHINSILIKNCDTIDKENIEKLYQYSHLIKNQISIHFNKDCIDTKKESVQIELLEIFHSKSRNYNNFVVLDDKQIFPYTTEALDFYKYNLPEYIKKIKILKKELKNSDDIYFCQHIKFLLIDFYQNNFKSLSNQLSFLKKYEYDIRDVDFYDYRGKINIRNYLLGFFMVFEIICNSMYRRNKVYHFQYLFNSNILSKKCKRYLKIHNINW